MFSQNVRLERETSDKESKKDKWVFLFSLKRIVKKILRWAGAVALGMQAGKSAPLIEFSGKGSLQCLPQPRSFSSVE